MKTFLLFLLSLSICHADFMQDRALANAGPMPEVTREVLPISIQNAIKDKLKDPTSAEFSGWSLPELKQTTHAGQPLAWWLVKVEVFAKNGYGAYITSTYYVTVKGGRVDRVTSR